MTSRPLTRRHLMGAGLAVAGGVALGAGVTSVVAATGDCPVAATFGADLVQFRGPHQPGIETPAPAHTWFVGLDLAASADRAAARRLMRVWTDDIERLMGGIPVLADQEKELVAEPSRLTVTLALGPAFFDRLHLDGRRPPSLRPLPSFAIDRLDARWRQTDLLLQVGADDVLAVSHAVRVLTRDARSIVDPVWVQRGFSRARGAAPPGTTPRNLMGQVDGTVNPAPGSDDLRQVVWASEGPSWWRGGTMMVLRRIRMELDSWEKVARADRELVIGRRIADGAPLSGETERDPVDLEARGPEGLLVIPEFAHVRHAKAQTDDERMLRRGFSYDDTGDPSAGDAGLLFCAFVADVDRQFLPVQRRLVGPDLLNRWTTPVGSGVYAVPPGCEPGATLCTALLDPG
jgi:dye decolorizing peroxidase